jgi:hypothetical protein
MLRHEKAAEAFSLRQEKNAQSGSGMTPPVLQGSAVYCRNTAKPMT